MNKETLDIFNKYLNHDKEIVILKSRQIGKSSMTSLNIWKKLFDKYNKAQDRKEKIRRIFNI